MKLRCEMRHNIVMKIAKLFLFIPIMLLSQAVNAEEESWYQVEVIVFERPLPDLDGEQWQLSDYDQRDSLVELLPRDEALQNGKPVPFSLLPVSRNRQAGSERVFRLSSDYRPLLHYSWQQPAYERQDARFVHIQKLTEEAAAMTATDAETEATGVISSEPTLNEPAFIETIVDPGYIVDGAIRIRSGFYLHVDVDLFYFTAIPQQNRIVQSSEQLEVNDPFAKFPIQLKETRKIKLNELHYFDHPMFGLIIQVSRLES